MEKCELQKLIEIAAGRQDADVVIKNARIADVYSGRFIKGDIAISDGYIAGIGEYTGKEEIEAGHLTAIPGLIDSHIHIESSYLSPHELEKLVVPHGTTTLIADPHEIVNVCGQVGLDYMVQAAKRTSLHVEYMLPSCVPATPFETSGAILDAKLTGDLIAKDDVLGLGEFMNFPGIIFNDEETIDKVMAAKRVNKVIDGHSPGVSGKDLNAYSCVGIRDDHECSTVEEMEARISRGMYVLLREGSACHDLETLLAGVTPENSRRCLFCSDDRQPKTILALGHIDNHLRMSVKQGIEPMTAIRMATLNAAECFELRDRGAIAPGMRADIVLVEDVENFKADMVFADGKLVAREGAFLPENEAYPIDAVMNSMHVKDFSVEKLKLRLENPRVNVIQIVPGGVLTKKVVREVPLDDEGNFVYQSDRDIVKMAVVERHQYTGNVGIGFLEGYGIKEGAVALTVAHDSHNIIVVGVSDEEMAFAVEALIQQGGGFVLVKDGQVLEAMPLPIAGLMSDQSGEWVDGKLAALHDKAYQELSVNGDIEPIMTLCFMSLAVIPELKLTDKGLFDVTKFDFINLEA